MIRYILRRLLIAVPVLLGITLIDYFIMSSAGNPLQMLQGARISQAAVELRAIELGLDKPFLVQYATWLGQILRGNLGYSTRSFQPVAEMIGRHLWPTVLLMGSSQLLAMALSLPIGIYSATRQYSGGDYAIVTLSFLGTSIPGFFLALICVYIFTVRLGWLPSGGMSTLGTGGGFWDVAAHMVMPVTVLCAGLVGSNIRYIRSSFLEILRQDYVRTARAKGIGRLRVVGVHALRNALLPVVTVMGLQIPSLFGGAVIVEQVFSWPGLGLMTMSAIMGRDYPVIMGVCLFSAVIVVAANLLTDIAYALVDPTIRQG